ncbi:hypothetical protein [Thermophagus xiamenensis]|jgi:hypothetical protein|uniref:Uncharacterized protein n=1 Tax=Thermophagus xiamenensis TaxID=385682 RepID=A0A1I1WH35_9BACT|nr:hypothetical protein [Thermophagus xiamenensis]SFD92400.1 hypothetical protein SAMN05444380_10431 [Thermophagus xiamenensis]
MNPKEFIKKRLQFLASKFSEAKIRYEYRENTHSHIIEIIPLNLYENNEDYLLEETRIEDEFEELFPTENIIFISENSLTEIKSPEFELGYSDFIFESETSCIEFEFLGVSEEVDPISVDYLAIAA